jgi:hypothetical protein
MSPALHLVLTVGASAFASVSPSPSLGFEWDAPAECPSAADVEARVAARVGAPLREGDGARLDVIARVRRDEAGNFAMRVWIIDERRTHRRDVVDADCDLLADAAATVVAVFVAPQVEPEPDAREPRPDPEPVVTPAPVVRPAPATPDPVARRRTRVVGGDLRVLGHAELGTLRGVGGGAGVGGNLDIARARLELLARGTFAAGVPLDPGAVAMRLWTVGVRAGFVPRWGRVELALMGGIEVGALAARGSGLPSARRGRVASSSLVAGPSVGFRPHPRVGLWLGLDGFVNLLRPRIVLDDGTLVHRPAPGGVRVSAGVGVRLGRDARLTEPRARRPPIGEDPAR